MERKEAILQIIRKAYQNDTMLFLSKKDLKSLEDVFKKAKSLQLSDSNAIYKYLLEKENNNVSFSENMAKEMDKQIKIGKVLQPEVLFEGNIAKTFADLFSLCDFLDFSSLRRENIKDKYELKKNHPFMPEEFYNYFDEHVRYMFYNEKSPDIFIAQYGDPDKIDLEIYYFGKIVKVEIKDMPAKSGEIDVRYNDDGKLLTDDRIASNHYEFVVTEFNKNYCIFDYLGHNIPIEKASMKTNMINEYIGKKDIDIIATSLNGKLLLISKNDLFFLSTAGSEIRTTGRNWGKPFVSKECVISQIKAITGSEIRGDSIRIPSAKMTNQKKRGYHNEMSAKKFANIFKINNEEYVENSGMVEFKYKKILQVKATISAHLSIDKYCSYEIIKKYYMAASLKAINGHSIDYIDGEGLCALILYYFISDKKKAKLNGINEFECCIFKTENWCEDMEHLVNDPNMFKPFKIEILQKSENMNLMNNAMCSLSTLTNYKKIALENRANVMVNPSRVIEIIEMEKSRERRLKH